MDDFAKDISLSSSSAPSKPSPNPRISIADSKEADENDQFFPKSQNPKKPSMRHFMAPTISAVSKATIPRKKILTERNDHSDSNEIHQQNTSNITPRISQLHLQNSSSRTFSRKTTSENSFHDSDDNENNDSSSKPYDPLTNYLSPRPKFLRYNPNKRMKLITQQKTEIGNEVDESDSLKSSVSSSIKSSETENEEINIVNKDYKNGLDDDDEEIEDFEKEGGLRFLGVFKFLLLCAVLFLLTWYISCMGSWEPLREMNLIKGATDGYINGYNNTYDMVGDSNNRKERVRSINEKQNKFSDKVLEKEFEGCLDPKGDGSVVLNREIAENDNDFGIYQVMENEISEKFQNEPNIHVFDRGNYHESEAVLEGYDHDEGIENAEIGDKSEYSDLVDTCVSENEERENSVSLDSEKEIETVKSFEGDEKVEEITMETDNNPEEGISLDFFSTKDSKINMIYGAFIGFFVIIASLFYAYYLKCKRTPIEKPRRKPRYTENISSENHIFPNLEKAHIKKAETYINPSSYFLSVEENVKDFTLTRAPTVELLGELTFGDVRTSMKSCNLKNKAKETEMKPKEMESQGDANYVFQDNVVNNSRSNLSTPEIPSSNVMDSPSYGELTVELLGELTFGDVRTSMKSCNLKNKAKETEMKPKEMESQGDANYVFQDNVVNNSRSNLSTPEIPSSNVMDSPSYGSFSDKKMIVNKEEGSAMTTPVRRSSRIRNRAMSP